MQEDPPVQRHAEETAVTYEIKSEVVTFPPSPPHVQTLMPVLSAGPGVLNWRQTRRSPPLPPPPAPLPGSLFQHEAGPWDAHGKHQAGVSVSASVAGWRFRGEARGPPSFVPPCEFRREFGFLKFARSRLRGHPGFPCPGVALRWEGGVEWRRAIAEARLKANVKRFSCRMFCLPCLDWHGQWVPDGGEILARVTLGTTGILKIRLVWFCFATYYGYLQSDPQSGFIVVLLIKRTGWTLTFYLPHSRE